ncbi:hypothetical protein [Sphingomonas sp. Root720]|nr:hypothetical protein [Sphingomonas sp. Root720]
MASVLDVPPSSLPFDSGPLHGPETPVSPTGRYLAIFIYPRGDG